LGTWLSIGSPDVAELAALSGFDWVLFDLEHGCYAESSVPDQLRALRGSNTLGIVRVAGADADVIARVLDWGADGIMAPHVDSAAAARRIVAAAYYPPIGRRGFSRSVRRHDYGLRAPTEARSTPLIMAQIESVIGVENAAAIAGVDGVDVLFVGPSDLQHDLANHPTKSLDDFDDCLNRVLAAASGAEKAAGILTRDTATIASQIDLGFTYLAVTSDLAILRDGYRQILTQGRASSAGQRVAARVIRET
jgi:2-dehydro-3-deoxyglucarate aldolase/4-hydroxy-2-oxoheptanedioate aldolase